MRLLNTETKTLEDTGSRTPAYAILSHRWLEEEVTLQDMSHVDVYKMKGYAKLSGACDMARSLGFKYLWMDTCCIDKTSSAELSESINSMYLWYRQAGICVAYLDDVTKEAWEGQFEYAQWFTRGWTLQELVAPKEVIFVEAEWQIIGTKTSLASVINDVTRIDTEVLLTGNMAGIAVAKKMSWAATRETTRLEDRAYSLLGIFEVNMPTIYGEGANAFVRLQEEIMKKSDDQSIFAWGDRISCSTSNGGQPTRDYQVAPESLLDGNIGLLAPGPESFEDADEIERIPAPQLESMLDITGIDSEFTVTNHGIRIFLPLQQIDSEREVYLAFLACGNADESNVFAIYLRHLSGSQYSRIPGYYNRPDLIDIPFEAIETSEVCVDEAPLYVGGHETEPWEQCLITGIDGESVVDFCERWNFTLDSDSAFRFYQGERETSYTMATDTDPEEEDNEQYFVMENKSLGIALLIVTTIDASLANRMQKDCVLITVCTLGPNGDIPYRQGQSPEDIYQTWHETKDPDVPVSHFAMTTLPDGRRITFAMICVLEPNWTNIDGPNDGNWILSVSMLDS